MWTSNDVRKHFQAIKKGMLENNGQKLNCWFQFFGTVFLRQKKEVYNPISSRTLNKNIINNNFVIAFNHEDDDSEAKTLKICELNFVS